MQGRYVLDRPFSRRKEGTVDGVIGGLERVLRFLGSGPLAPFGALNSATNVTRYVAKLEKDGGTSAGYHASEVSCLFVANTSWHFFSLVRAVCVFLGLKRVNHESKL